MITTLYQEYLHLIGKLKDVFDLTIDVEHRDIHTFYKNKRPLFKLMFGTFEKDDSESIVVTFHIDLYHPEVISWFIAIHNIYPLAKLHDSYIEDSSGQTYLGEEAEIIKRVLMTQEVLEEWLNRNTKEEMQDFVEADVVGFNPDEEKKTFDSQNEYDQAIIKFEKLRRPGDGDGVH